MLRGQGRGRRSPRYRRGRRSPTLEVTESVFVRDSKRALFVLNDLRDIGVKLALDDFGTGYSSLSYLMRFPVDIVKVDRTFVAELEEDSASHTIGEDLRRSDLDLPHVQA